MARLSRARDLFLSEGMEKTDNYQLSQFFCLAGTRPCSHQSQDPVLLLICLDQKMRCVVTIPYSRVIKVMRLFITPQEQILRLTMNSASQCRPVRRGGSGGSIEPP